MAASCLILCLGNLFAQSQWVATWATSPEPLVSAQSSYNPPSPGLANNSVRQVLRVSVGGDTLRMRFTNEYTNSAVKINAATIAVSAGGGIIDTTTLHYFKFGGQDSVTMPANAYVWSDPLAFHLDSLAKVEVTLNFGAAPASGTYPGITVHRGSRTTPRVLAGNQVAARTFAGAATITQASWVISSMEVRAPQSAGAIAILGNSITDGYGITNDSFTRWTDVLTTNLQAHARTRTIGVLNGGIGGGTMLSGGTSTPGLQRYQRDLFDHSGVKWVIILLGVNDIGNTGCSVTTSDNMIAAYTQIADSAHARNIKVYGATITPFNGNSYYSTSSETCRRNINAWVRTTTRYDAVIDFDKIVRNPSDTSRILAAINNDGLHPNIAGYALMGNSVDTNLFIQSVTSVMRPRDQKGYSLGEVFANHFNGNTTISFEIPHEAYVSLKVLSMQGKEIAELAGRNFSPGKHTVEFKSGNLAKGVYLYSIKTDRFSVSRKMILPIY